MSKLVLIVEDSPTQLEVLKNIVEGAGYEVRTSISGEEALKMVVLEPFSFVVLDLLLPRVDGFEVCRRIKRDPKTNMIKVIAITSFDVADIQDKATSAGVDEILIKPFKPEDLEKKLNKLV